MSNKFWLAIALLTLAACSPAPEQATQQASAEMQQTSQESANTNAIQSGLDYHSYANPSDVKLTHIALDLTVDFDTKSLLGSAELSFSKQHDNAEKIILDTRDLSIEKVTANGQALEYQLAEADENLGSALTIKLPEQGNKLTITYSTSPDASGVQWLTPEQTAGRQHPFLFTQAQATHARSFIPLQDSPQVRVTYSATIRTPEELLAVMSASNDPKTPRDGVYEFEMPQPIPSYLIALAVGDLHFKAMGERTGVYSEMAYLEAAAKEFEDTESMLIKTEALYGEYQWGRYDLLILPPSFPFGGMENPRLSFITPTVIAGDKSLVSLIAHELAHSWSGNATTNAAWRDLWLNEGFTTYLTYRIMELVFGTDRFNMEAVLGYQDLLADINALPEHDQIMAIDLRGRDPDDVFSNIPYEKGALFLRELEYSIGRDNFDTFLRQYFADFAFQSITTDQFLEYLLNGLVAKHADKLDVARIQEWIFEPGIPAGAPVPESNAFELVDDARAAWFEGAAASSIEVSNWTVHQWLYFLNNMPEGLADAQLAELDSTFNLTQGSNNEIVHSWLLLAINYQYEPAFERLHNYLVSIGRNKLVKPLYRALSETDWGKPMAQKAFAQAKAGYHPLTVKANEGFVQ